MITTLSSAQNPSVKLVTSLLSNSRQRNKQQKTIIEGIHLIESCMRAQNPLEQILVSQAAINHPEVEVLLSELQTQQPQIPIRVLEDKIYKNIRTLGNGVDIMAVIPIIQRTLADIHSDCLVLDGVQDNGNMGTLLRTASAIGIEHIICTKGTAGAWSPKTLRAGMGAQFSLNIYEQISITEALTKIQVPLLATSSHSSSVVYQQNLTTPVAWVMGHEGQGVCEQLLAQATAVTLPQPNGQESLNVAIAGALCMYEMLRQRQYA